MNKRGGIGLIIILIFSILLLPFASGDYSGAAIHIYVYVNEPTPETTEYEKTCSGTESTTECELENIVLSEGCWRNDEAVANGWDPTPRNGTYYVVRDINPVGQAWDYGTPTELWDCLDEGFECTADDYCVSVPSGGDGQGHCVLGKVDPYSGTTTAYCQPLDPWCPDEYCDTSKNEVCLYEDYPIRTHSGGLYDSTVCQYKECDGVYAYKDLPTGDYPGESPSIPGVWFPYPNGSWECNAENHCENATCITDCWDEDADGYGIQPNEHYNASICDAQYSEVDCADDRYYVHPNATGYANPPSSYCDCNTETGNAFTQGTFNANGDPFEGPINLALPIAQDICFDSTDNDCDGPSDPLTTGSQIDCRDPDCYATADGYTVRNRTCVGDCTTPYQTEMEHDRACCPSPTDCTIDGMCIPSNNLSGEFPDKHYCYNSEWYGGDHISGVCQIIVEDANYDPYTYSHWNLSGNAGGGLCCGDDRGEYYIPGLYEPTHAACCATPGATVVGGECIEEPFDKYSWDRVGGGYCQTEGQCLVNPDEYSFDGTVVNATDIDDPYANPVRCIENGEFIGDHYCNNGIWTSRTGMLASQLLSFADDKEDASMFCENYDRVLNYYGYALTSGYAEHYLGVQSFECKIGETEIPCTNNVCVLEYGEGAQQQVLIATSLNHEIDSDKYSILEALGGTKSDCNGQLNSATFESCGTGVWYNGRIKSVIYSEGAISITDVLYGDFVSTLQNVFGQQISELATRNPSTYDFGFVTQTQDYNKVYASKNVLKNIVIIVEELAGKKYMSARYTNFVTDICSMIENYWTNANQYIELDCNQVGSDVYVTTGGLSEEYYAIMEDLGPKLRIE